MCRYLLAVPPSPTDKQHKLRLLYGNGLRPQVSYYILTNVITCIKSITFFSFFNLRFGSNS